jgi:hypothetical protein
VSTTEIYRPALTMSKQGSNNDNMRKYCVDLNNMSNDHWVEIQRLGIPSNRSIPTLPPSPSKPTQTPQEWVAAMHRKASLGKQTTTGQQPSATGSGGAASGYPPSVGTTQTGSKKK